MYLKRLKIGNVELENNIILAPMAGITDKAFRQITKEFNPGLVVTEMASAKAIYYQDKKTKELLDIGGEQQPISVQLFGSDILAIKEAVKEVNKFADIIDINMGCPAPKVVKNGDGSKLLKNLDLAYNIIKAANEVAAVPVTVKTRLGWDDKSIVIEEFAKLAELAGAKMLTVHGRTREQYYSGQVDLDQIKIAKKAVNIPVIGNGDIKSSEDAKKMFEHTGVDGIMIGRAAIGNPWLIEDIISYLHNEKNYIKKTISLEEKQNLILKHIELITLYKGENIGVKEMRKFISYYVKNLKDATKIREQINKIEDKNELIQVIKEYFKSL